MNIPEKDRTFDKVEVTLDEALSRHIQLTHRAESIMLALKQCGIPLSRFTHEALCMVTENLDFALAPKEDAAD